ncbi:MAG: tetratricopeptide repeat protein, partial [Xanthomonadales bacterium]|nr:tetratricopeptide repeat protein [Xanthomonadales bacterium]
RAIELSPGRAETWGDTATLLFLLGRLDEAIALTDHVVRMDPLNATSWFNHGLILAADHRWDESISAFRTVLRLSPDASEAHYYLALSLLGAGSTEEALAEIELESIPERQSQGRAMIYSALNLEQESDAALQDFVEYQPSPMDVAKVHAARGETNLAFEWLETAVQAASPELAEIHVDPWLASLKSDPRWIELVAQLGRSPEQLEVIRFDVVLPGG